MILLRRSVTLENKHATVKQIVYVVFGWYASTLICNQAARDPREPNDIEENSQNCSLAIAVNRSLFSCLYPQIPNLSGVFCAVSAGARMTVTKKSLGVFKLISSAKNLTRRQKSWGREEKGFEEIKAQQSE